MSQNRQKMHQSPIHHLYTQEWPWFRSDGEGSSRKILIETQFQTVALLKTNLIYIY